MNVVPNEAEAGFDIRIAPQVDIEQFRKKVRRSASYVCASYVRANAWHS